MAEVKQERVGRKSLSLILVWLLWFYFYANPDESAVVIADFILEDFGFPRVQCSRYFLIP